MYIWRSFTRKAPTTPRLPSRTIARWCESIRRTRVRRRALATDHLAQGRSDDAWCCLEILDLLGLSNSDERAVLDRHALPERPTDEPYAGVIGEAERKANLAHPSTRVISDVFAALWEGVPGLSHPSLESLGVTAKDKVSAISHLDVAKIFSQAGKALSNQRAGLYLKPDADFAGVRLVAAAPTAVVIGKSLAEGGSTAELRFRIGHALELLRPEYVLAATMDPVALDDLFTATLKAFHPKHNRWRAGSEDSAAEEAAKLKKALPYKLAKRIAEVFHEHADDDIDCARWRAAVLETGNRRRPTPVRRTASRRPCRHAREHDRRAGVHQPRTAARASAEARPTQGIVALLRQSRAPQSACDSWNRREV